jgi:GR25 family glycosyltransferase involved in LPS biosynthesis
MENNETFETFETEFKFYEGLDSIGHDIIYVGRKSVDELKTLCLFYENCIGFNTLGYLKRYICDESNLKPVSAFNMENDGLYVNVNRLSAYKETQNNVDLDGYVFFKNKDIFGNDIKYVKHATLQMIKNEADSDPRCKAFNTLGWLKHTLIDKQNFSGLDSDAPTDGLYIKKEFINEINTIVGDINAKTITNPTDIIDDLDTVLDNSDDLFDDSMRIKCINLVRRPDRKESMTKLLGEHDLIQHCDFFEAIDGKLLQPTDEIKKIFTGNDFGTIRAVIGCALSHKTLWEQLVEDPVYDRYLILEDDIELVNGFKSKLYQVTNEMNMNHRNYDIVYLGCSVRNVFMDKYRAKCKNIEFMTITEYDTSITIGGLFGYIISKSGANKFLKFINKHGIKHGIDYLMFRYAKEMNIKHYEVLPHIVNTEYVTATNKVDSDIQYDTNRLF